MNIKYKLKTIAYAILIVLNLNANMRLGFLGTCLTDQCGISLYIKNFNKSLKLMGYHLYNYDYKDDIGEIKKNIINDKIKILNIQYEPNIMSEKEQLINIINYFKTLDIKVIITIHEERDYIDEIINHCDFAIYHTKPVYSKSKNINFLKMGSIIFNPEKDIAGFRKKYGYKLNDKILVSTGFLLFTKEIDQILLKLIPYLKNDPQIKIQLLHSFTNRYIEGCQYEYDKVKKVINDFDLKDQVHLISDFLPQKELNERIYLSDLGYQWLSWNQPSSSASALQYISSRTPLIIPNVTHYKALFDIKGVTVTQHDKDIFISEMIKLLNNSNKLKSSRMYLNHAYKELNWNKICQKYIQLLKKLT